MKEIELMTLDKVAEILQVSKQKVAALIKEGQLKVVKIGPRSRRITRDDLNDYINTSRKQ